MRWFLNFTLAIGIVLTLSSCGEDGASQGSPGLRRAAGGVAATMASRMRAERTVRIAGSIPWGAPHTAKMTARIRFGLAGIAASDTTVDVGRGERHREIRIGAVTYEDQPPETMPPGKRWTMYAQPDEADPGSSSLRIGDDSALDPADPEMLRLLLTRSGRGTSATVDGITVTEYGGTADLAQLVGVARGAQRRTLAALVSAGVAPITWRLWIDEGGLPHRFTETLTHGQTMSTPQEFSTETTTVVYSHWGLPDMIEAPPTDQVVDDAAQPLPPLSPPRPLPPLPS